jgi:hypothetical protein
MAEKHKHGLNMTAESIDVILTTPFSSPIVSTIKFDGEHNIVFWTGGDDCQVANSYGTMRAEMPPTKELAQIFKKKGLKQVILAGELYAVWEDGKKMALNDVMHHIKSPKDEKEESRIRIAVFDIVSLDGQPVVDDYWKKIVLLNDLIGQNQYVHVVPAQQGDVSVAKDMWERDVVGKKMEGLVIHTPGGIIKVKVISNMDLVIIGMKKEGERFPLGLAGALLPAFMMKDGTFLITSKVGTGLNTSEQKEWFDWVMQNQRGEQVIENETFVMCEPKRILEIGANEWYAYDKPKVAGLRFESNAWRKVGVFPGVKGQKPRFQRDHQGKIMERQDKKVNPIDLRLTQCPDFQDEWLDLYAPQKAPDIGVWNAKAIASIFGKHNPSRVVHTYTLPSSNNPVFHLPIEQAVYVPSTTSGDQPISDTEFQQRIADTQLFLSRYFGGHTTVAGTGGYISKEKGVIQEPVVKVVSFATNEAFEKHRETLKKWLLNKCVEWGQESIGYEVEGDLFYLSPNPKISVPWKVVIKSNEEMGDYIALHGLVPGNELPEKMREKIPANEIWIRRDVYDDEPRRKKVLAHEKAELTLMTQRKLPYKKAHAQVERKERKGLNISEVI